MSQNQGSTQGVTNSEYEDFLWRELLHIVEHTYDHLDDTGCFQKEELAYYKAIIEATYNLYLDDSENKKRQAKTLIVEMVKQFLNALLGCG